MRLVREFAEALELLLKKDVRKQQAEIQRMYDQYVGPYAFYHTAAVADIMESMEQWDERERLPRLEMLAELWYAEGSVKQQPLRNLLLDKAVRLYDYVDGHSPDFSLVRKQKMAMIRSLMAKGEQERTAGQAQTIQNQ